MAKTIDIELQKQLDKPQAWFCKYFPKRIQNVGEKEIADRQLVYDFKDGRSHEAVAQMTAARMIEEHGSGCSKLVFIPVPASSVRKDDIRYMEASVEKLIGQMEECLKVFDREVQFS